MNKLWGKYFIAIILTVSVIATLTGFITAQAQMQTPASQGWEAEWQKTLEAGRKEGTVSVYVSLLAPAVRKQAPIYIHNPARTEPPFLEPLSGKPD
ncbi:MAG: hypothetical protein U1D67_00945, partial [Dehalococcoidia bacterium]|nr:hypothetical protein [Dehalococcoidia bacterium]